MNLLPPRPWSKRFFGLWLSLIFLFFAASILGTFVIQEKLIKKVDVLEKDVHLKRKTLYEARKKEKEEMDFMKKNKPIFEYKDTVNQIEENQIHWHQVMEVVEHGLPDQSELLQLKVIGDRVMGWGRFDSSQVATEYVNKLVQNHSDLIRRGWIDCIGETCFLANQDSANIHAGTLVQFQFEIKRESKKVREGGDSPLENRLPEDVGNPA